MQGVTGKILWLGLSSSLTCVNYRFHKFGEVHCRIVPSMKRGD